MQKFDPTTQAGRPLLSIDFSRLLPAGVTIASAAVTIAVHELSQGNDADPAARLDGDAIVSDDHMTVSQWFAGGIEDVDYVLSFIATFSDGQIEPVEALMSVRHYF
jgi:hypothetical protein